MHIFLARCCYSSISYPVTYLPGYQPSTEDKTSQVSEDPLRNAFLDHYFERKLKRTLSLYVPIGIAIFSLVKGMKDGNLVKLISGVALAIFGGLIFGAKEDHIDLVIKGSGDETRIIKLIQDGADLSREFTLSNLSMEPIPILNILFLSKTIRSFLEQLGYLYLEQQNALSKKWVDQAIQTLTKKLICQGFPEATKEKGDILIGNTCSMTDALDEDKIWGSIHEASNLNETMHLVKSK